MSTKALFIGPYRQSCGWGYAARDYLRMLRLTGWELAARPVYMSQSYGTGIGDEFIDLEEHMLSGRPDIVIQNVLPDMFDYQPHTHNIGLCYIETQNLQATGWIQRMNLLDEIWVSSTHEADTLRDSGVDPGKVCVVQMPLNTERLDSIDNIEPLKIPDMEDCYIFYYIGEYIKRKNLATLIVAFQLAFNKSQPVRLVIKTNTLNTHPVWLINQMQNELEILKSHLRLRRDGDYPSEFIMTDYITDDEIIGLHKRCDCFVIPSRGEALNRPNTEALYLGNMSLSTSHTGMSDVTPHECQIAAYNSPCITHDQPKPELYTSHELWREPDVSDLAGLLKRTYDQRGNTEIHHKRHKEFQEYARGRLSYKAISDELNQKYS